MKFCSECGTSTGPGTKFCGGCGTQIQALASPPPPYVDVIDASPARPAYAFTERTAPPHAQHHTPPPPAVMTDEYSPAINLLDIRTLPIGSKLAIYWSFFWRGCIVSLGSLFITLILGLLVENQTSPVVLLVVGLVMMGVGFYCGYLWIRWLLTASIGSFKLLLVKSSELKATTPI